MVISAKKPAKTFLKKPAKYENQRQKQRPLEKVVNRQEVNEFSIVDSLGLGVQGSAA